MVFEPTTEGVVNFPNLDPGHGPINLYFQQHFPLFLDGQKTFDQFIDELAGTFLDRAQENFQTKLNRSLGNRPRTRPARPLRITSWIRFTGGGRPAACSTGMRKNVGPKTCCGDAVTRQFRTHSSMIHRRKTPISSISHKFLTGKQSNHVLPGKTICPTLPVDSRAVSKLHSEKSTKSKDGYPSLC